MNTGFVFSNQTRSDSRFDYSHIYRIRKIKVLPDRSKLNISQAIVVIKDNLESTDEIKKILTFLNDSDRGII